MASIIRSEEMAKCNIYIQSEAAYSVISEIGEIGIVQFVDMNQDINAFQRKFISDIKRCTFLERSLNYLQENLNKDGILPNELIESLPAPSQNDIIDLE
ncbi:hypothetical protein A3Q56_07511, partial [Intoshia linei]